MEQPSTPAQSVSPFMTEPEAAIRLRIAPKTLRNWRSNGQGPEFLRRNRIILYEVDAVDAWARAGAVAPLDEPRRVA